MLVLALLFALSIFMNGSSFAAIHGGWAMRLDLSGSEIIPFIPWLATGLYIGAVIGVKRIRRAPLRWISFIVVTLAGMALGALPVWMLERGSVRIPVADFPSKEAAVAFEAKYPVRWVSYSASGEGHSVRVRKEDYSPELAEFITALIARQAAGRSGS
jgi:hypothetical protein